MVMALEAKHTTIQKRENRAIRKVHLSASEPEQSAGGHTMILCSFGRRYDRCEVDTSTLSLMRSNILPRTHTISAAHPHSRGTSSRLPHGGMFPKNAARHKQQQQQHSRRRPTERRENERDKRGRRGEKVSENKM